MDPSTNYSQSECVNPLDNVDWFKPGLLVSLVVLGLINVLVLAGNSLVVLAVFLDSRLRTVTNLFIVSLAVADLSVGMAVLPFSASLEVLDVWIYGEVWCSVWLAVDVWMCTASILNLCAISLDRYLAVTRPMVYPSLMSPTRAKILIGLVWTVSFVICFPPLVGWNDRKANVTEQMRNDCRWTCELTNDAGYVVYSALGSFFLPTLVMFFFYWRIYRAAVKTTEAINQGFRTTKNGSKRFGRFPEKQERLTLRIHRGRSGQPPITSVLLAKHGPLGLAPALAGLGGREMARLALPTDSEETSAHGSAEPTNGLQLSLQSGLGHHNQTATSRSNTRAPWCTRAEHCRACCPCDFAHADEKSRRSRAYDRDRRSSQAYRVLYMETTFCNHYSAHDCRKHSISRSHLGMIKDPLERKTRDHPDGHCSSGEQPKPVHKLNRRNIKAQVKRFRMETKAAKTVGIIVGGFICCWLPFFTMYVIRAFCEGCIPPLLFSVLFWLGYCNSAINPCIYALFSRDFRFAFKRILCKCLCTKKSHSHPVTSVTLAHHTCFSEESDYVNDHSESN